MRINIYKTQNLVQDKPFIKALFTFLSLPTALNESLDLGETRVSQRSWAYKTGAALGNGH